MLFYVSIVCKCVLYYCHRVATQLQLTNVIYIYIYIYIYFTDCTGTYLCNVPLLHGFYRDIPLRFTFTSRIVPGHILCGVPLLYELYRDIPLRCTFSSRFVPGHTLAVYLYFTDCTGTAKKGPFLYSCLFVCISLNDKCYY